MENFGLLFVPTSGHAGWRAADRTMIILHRAWTSQEQKLRFVTWMNCVDRKESKIIKGNVGRNLWDCNNLGKEKERERVRERERERERERAI